MTILLLLAMLGAGPAREPAVAIERRIFAAANQERRARGVPALKWDERVADQARRHSRNMAQRRFFSHSDPILGDVAKRLNRAGIAWTACAENIFTEQGMRNPAVMAVTSWMHSSGHRRNLLSPRYTHTGIGVAVSADGTHTITQEFVTY